MMGMPSQVTILGLAHKGLLEQLYGAVFPADGAVARLSGPRIITPSITAGSPTLIPFFMSI
jgi:hypothetical protein